MCLVNLKPLKKPNKQPWPTKDVMNQIYEKNLWGGNDFDFYSGKGSHHPNIIKPYLEAVIIFFKSFDKPLTVCDLGCGDFNIGKHLVKFTKKYIGVDIVENLIERNKKTFKEERLTFHCLDISEEKLPNADCVLLRQVLQHLSNTEIKKIVEKLSTYKYIILTEHIPNDNFKPNTDIISGQGNRVKYSSGLDILEAPFNFKVKEVNILNEHHLENNKGRIVTMIFKTS